MNRWDEEGVPQRGWECVNVYDLKESGQDYATCEMCGKEEIRYVHVMRHPGHPDLEVGCVCAGHMEQDYQAALTRERAVRNRSARRKNWLSRRWRLSAKGNPYLNVSGRNVGVFPAQSGWRWRVGHSFGAGTYPTPDQAKLALFDDLYPKGVLQNG